MTYEFFKSCPECGDEIVVAADVSTYGGARQTHDSPAESPEVTVEWDATDLAQRTCDEGHLVAVTDAEIEAAWLDEQDDDDDGWGRNYDGPDTLAERD